MKSWVTEQIRQRGLEKQFHLLGHRPAEQMPDYFATADALLVTLRADPAFALTVPSKVQSYLACGKPIIAALNGEGADIVIESGAGISCSAGNPDKLAEAVLTLYRMPAERRKAMGAKARKYFESHFEREMLLDQLQKWMREVVDNKPCAY
jgi:glycosyltransferase involved in cell wall biosynthesis